MKSLALSVLSASVVAVRIYAAAPIRSDDTDVNPHDRTVYLPTVERQVNEHFHVVHNPKTGRHLAFWTQESWEGSSDIHIMFTRSSDGGRTWSAPRLLWGSPSLTSGVANAAYQLPMVSRSGRVYCVWNQCVRPGRGRGDGVMMGACSDDDGETWTTPAKIMEERHWCCWQRPLRLASGNRFLTAVSIASQKSAKTAFFRFENIDDDPDAQDVRVTVIGDDNRLEGEEASLVKLPDGRLFAVMRSRFGHPLWTVSGDGGETWSASRPLKDETGAVIRHPRAPCPIYDLDGDDAASGSYFALFTDTYDPKISQWHGRGPLFRYSGTFDPKSEQPVKFSKGKLLMPRTASSHYGNSCYSSYTVVGDERTLWYPDNKRRLYGALISARESNGAVAPR